MATACWHRYVTDNDGAAYCDRCGHCPAEEYEEQLEALARSAPSLDTHGWPGNAEGVCQRELDDDLIDYARSQWDGRKPRTEYDK